MDARACTSKLRALLLSSRHPTNVAVQAAQVPHTCEVRSTGAGLTGQLGAPCCSSCWAHALVQARQHRMARGRSQSHYAQRPLRPWSPPRGGTSPSRADSCCISSARAACVFALSVRLSSSRRNYAYGDQAASPDRGGDAEWRRQRRREAVKRREAILMLYELLADSDARWLRLDEQR
jgi:hypothetical protein